MTPGVLTYFDSCVIIAASDSNEPSHKAARQALSAEDVELVSSHFLMMETVGAAERRVEPTKARFAQVVLGGAKIQMPVTEELLGIAYRLCSIPGGLKSMDALHAACAISAGAALVTLDKGLIAKGRSLGLNI